MQFKYDTKPDLVKDIGKSNYVGSTTSTVPGVSIDDSNRVLVVPNSTDVQLAYASYLYSRMNRSALLRGTQGYRVILLDATGRMLNNEPKNVSQNEKFLIRVVVPAGQEFTYDIRVDEGEYAPTDFVVRPYEAVNPITTATANSGSVGTAPPPSIAMTYVEFERGPYTSQRFKFSLLQNVNASAPRVRGEYSVRINPIYHAGVGVSIVNSWLENPSYETRGLADGSSTIVATNTGQRALLSFNVIWYWRNSIRTLLRPNRTGGELTQGRDVLKEGGFWDRLNPTIGVGLNEKLLENYFGGLTFEIARGFSVVGGGHYGQVMRFDDPNFELGVSPFSGAANQIPVTRQWKTEWFFGVTVDTRVINLLNQNRQ